MQPHIPLCVYQIKCSERDMHSGVIGGSVHEAMLTLAITLTLTPTLTIIGPRGGGAAAGDLRDA